MFLLVHGWAWADAGRHLTEAIRLEPDAEAIRPSYALWLATSGRFEEALAEIDFALQRRPYHVGWIGIRASILYLAGRYSEALAAADEALAIDDGDRGAWEWRSRALWQMGARREAISALSYGVFAEHAEPLDRAVLEGGAEAGVRLLLELTDSASLRVQHSWRRAPWRLWLGDLDGALAELEVAVATRRFNAIYLGVDPLFAGLRGDPRFTAIVERIGAGADAGEPSLQ